MKRTEIVPEGLFDDPLRLQAFNQGHILKFMLAEITALQDEIDTLLDVRPEPEPPAADYLIALKARPPNGNGNGNGNGGGPL